MRKFTFITLVMILGMSSVSFGKEYLCIPTSGVFLMNVEQGNTLQPSNQLSGKSLIVKTEDNDSKMVSVKEFGRDSYHCKVGEVLRDNSYNDVTSGVGESMKGEDVLTCRQPHTSSEGSYTQYEFNLHLRHMFFNSYYMSIRGIRVGHIRGGKCEEI